MKWSARKRSVGGLKTTWLRQVAGRLTGVVVGCQAPFLVTLWVTPVWLPPKMRFIELVWAWMHRPTFYPLMVLVIAGPILSAVAWCCPGRHRLRLVASWLGLAVVLFWFHHDRVTAMLRVLWWQWID